jgi:hypothetical protein
MNTLTKRHSTCLREPQLTQWVHFLQIIYMSPRKHTKRHGKASRQSFPLRSNICPHWSPCDKLCLIVEKGLYLPLDRHINKFCLTGFHKSCKHYKLADPVNDHGEDRIYWLNRRRFVRIPSHLSFRFSEIVPDDTPPRFQQDDAWTIDLGGGGLCFVSRLALSPKTTIQFFLKSNGIIPSIQGIGSIVWAQYQENTTCYHTGMVFLDRKNPSSSANHP